MKAQRLVPLTAMMLGAARKTCGLALVLAASANVALAGALPPPLPAPEIDPGSMASALTLLAGGLFLMRERWVRK
jgi:hypothetical protein